MVNKSWLRKLAERPLRALGIEPVPTWEIYDYAKDFVHAEMLRNVFATKSVDCVFDVGAFNGHFGRFLRDKVGFTGTILSFEPLPDPFRVLSESAENDSNWHVFPIALGAEAGTFAMNVASRLWFSSFLNPNENLPDSMVDGNTVVSKINTEIGTIADLFETYSTKFGFSRPFLKMDTQGYDLQVFRGAAKYVQMFQGIQSEVAAILIYEGMPDWKESIAEYERAGFELAGFFPVSNDAESRAIELDAIMVRIC